MKPSTRSPMKAARAAHRNAESGHIRAYIALLSALGCWLAPSAARGFCGFYVAGADTQLYNNATMVVLLREGTRTVLSMQNNYQGPAEDFALVVPVPVVLAEDNVKTLPRTIFERVDTLASPRLVEYWEQDPCMVADDDDGTIGMGVLGASGTGAGYGRGSGGDPQVVVEAEFAVGEYQIVILSAKDALALETWLTDNGYKIPANAARYLAPYVARGEKFFVAKVDVDKVTYKDGMATLSPLRMYYDTDNFSLPIRLGLINAKQAQDLIVHILAPRERFQVANYKNVTIPTNLSVREPVRGRFGEFYAALFDAALARNPGAVITEYAWDSGTCDPCPDTPLSANELYTLGLDVVRANAPSAKRSVLRMSRPAVKGSMDSTLIQRFLMRSRSRFMRCHDKALADDASFTGRARLSFTIDATGRVTKAKVSGAPARPGAKAFSLCIEQTAAGMRFPAAQSGGVNLVTTEIRLAAGARTASAAGYVLTRLHARYTADNVGEDLVFEAAEPIAGGQGGATPASKEAAAAGQNTFQGRYIIHHEWTGEMACESPRRGIWGGPPAGLEDAGTTRIARDLAFVARGKMALGSVVREPIAALAISPSEAAPGTGRDSTAASPATTVSPATAASPAPASESPDSTEDTNLPVVEPGKRSSGCNASLGVHPAGADAWVLGLGAWLWLVLFRRRRRESHGQSVSGTVTPCVGSSM